MSADINTLVPTETEVRSWILHTVQHVCRVEYCLDQLGLGNHDPERPHDIVGRGNKFEWQVLSGLAIQYRDRSPAYFERHVLPSLELHRCQYHHRCWNQPNDKATADDMKLGAVDAICSLLEARSYQGGTHSFLEIEAKADANPPHKRPWLSELIPEIRKLVQPRVHEIVSLDAMPNIGISSATFDIIRARVEDTRLLLREYGYTL